METAEIEKTLLDHGVNPTAVRILVYRHIERQAHTFSLADMEAELESVDKSTLFRTLQLFAANHLIHVVDDGSGSKKYCVCRHQHPCAMSQMHCHFRCEKCGTTYCIPQLTIPPAILPPGFEARRTEMLFTGLCSNCSKSEQL